MLRPERTCLQLFERGECLVRKTTVPVSIPAGSKPVSSMPLSQLRRFHSTLISSRCVTTETLAAAGPGEMLEAGSTYGKMSTRW